MNGLQVARVVVIDDEPLEAVPLLNGLAKVGIAAAYFTGAEDEYPKIPLTGIRLVFLDLHLVGGGMDTHSVIMNTIGVLSMTVSATRGETGIICWTRHAEELELLKKMLEERFPTFMPSFLLSLSKADFIAVPGERLNQLAVQVRQSLDAVLRSLGGAKPEVLRLSLEETVGKARELEILAAESSAPRVANVGKISEQVNKVLDDRHGSRLIWDWEKSVHEAAGATTSLLSEMAASNQSGYLDREDRLMSLLAALAAGAGGTQFADAASCVAGMFEGLNPIHYDYLDRLAQPGVIGGDHCNALQKRLSADTKVAIAHQAQINGAILTEKVTEGDSRFQPGNLYLPDAKNSRGCPHALCGIDALQLGNGLLKPKSNDLYNELRRKIDGRQKLGLSDEQVTDLRTQANAEQNKIFESSMLRCHVGLLEVSAACDFANKQFVPARFVGTLLVPDEIANTIGTGDYIRRVKPMTLPKLDGIWHILINSRFIFGLTNPRDVIRTSPLVRLRYPVLIDIQAWLAAQVARPGYLAV